MHVLNLVVGTASTPLVFESITYLIAFALTFLLSTTDLAIHRQVNTCLLWIWQCAN